MWWIHRANLSSLYRNPFWENKVNWTNLIFIAPISPYRGVVPRSLTTATCSGPNRVGKSIKIFTNPVPICLRKSNKWKFSILFARVCAYMYVCMCVWAIVSRRQCVLLPFQPFPEQSLSLFLPSNWCVGAEGRLFRLRKRNKMQNVSGQLDAFFFSP